VLLDEWTEATARPLLWSLLNLPATAQAPTYSQDGPNYRNSNTMCSPVQLHPTQASGESNHQEGTMAATPTPQQDRSWSSTALGDSLGAWLIGDAQASIQRSNDHVTNANRMMNDATVGLQLYRDMVFDIDVECEGRLQRMRTRIETRDIAINTLSHAVLKLLADNPDEVMQERIRPTLEYVQQLRSRSLTDAVYDCRLMSEQELMSNVNMELTAEVLIDLTTDEDTEPETDQEIIDLTYDSDDETDMEQD